MMAISTHSALSSQKKELKLDLKTLLIAGAALFLIGCAQTLLIERAFFNQSEETMQKKIAADKEVVEALMNKCEIFSNAGITFNTDGTYRVDCTLDLAYFYKLEDMKRKLQKSKQDYKKPSA